MFIGKMPELTEEANEENCLSSGIGTWYVHEGLATSSRLSKLAS